MPAKSRLKTPKQLERENADLRMRLEEAEEILHAIRSGQVDALIVAAEQGEQVYTLKGADQPYRILIEEMSEGALTITAAGDIVYCNRRFAEMLGTPIEKLMGSSIYHRVERSHQKGLRMLLKAKSDLRQSEEMDLVAGDGRRVPVHLSINRIAGPDEQRLFALVVTDLTEQKRSAQIVAQEKLARSILSQALEAIVVCDESGRIIRANEVAGTLCGDNPLGQTFARAFALRLGDGRSFSLAAALQGERRQGLETQMERGGNTFHLLVSAAPLLGVRNKVLGCVVTLTDITEREQAERSLRAAKDAAENEKQRLQAVMDALPIGVAITDVHGGNIQSNGMFDSVWGGAHPPARSVGDYVAFKARWLDSGKPVLPEEWASGQAIQQGAPVVGQLMEIERFDGARGYVINSAAPVRDAAGTIVGAAVAIQDISELRHAQDALRESEDKYRRLIENVDDLVCEVDAAAKYQYVNSQYEQILGYAPEELLGKYVRELIHPDDLKQSTPSFKKLVGGGTLSRNEWRFKHKNGAWRWFDCIAQTYERSPGDTRVVVISRDVTDRKKRETELQRLSRTLRALSNVNQAMMRIQDEAEFLQQVCRIVVEDCGHAMVWIGYAEEDEAKSVRPVASAGFEEGYLQTLKISWADTERGRGPTGTAIRTGKPSACSNMLTDPNFQPWRAEALKRNYASSIVLPLLAEGKAFGAITIYSRDPDPFSDDEVKLLTELAGDLSFGVIASRLRAARSEAEDALRRSEERYHSLFNAMTEGFALHEIICDEEGNPCDYSFLDLNPAFERLTGLKREQVIGKTMRQVLPDDDPAWIEAYGRVALTGEPTRFENYSPALNRHYEVFAYSPAPRQFAVVFSEITERKRAEELLRKKQATLQGILDATQESIWLFDPTGIILQGNATAFLRLQMPAEKVVGKSFSQVLPEQLARERMTYLNQVVESGRPIDLKDERAGIIFHHHFYPIKDVDGRVIQIAAFSRDITESERAEQKLRQSEERFRSVLDNSLDCIYRLNLQTGCYDYMSPSVEKIVGYTSEELIAQGVKAAFAMIHPADLATMQAALKRLDETGDVEAEYRQRTKSGDYRWISNHMSLIRDGAGHSLYRDGNIRDVTERKRIEEALRESEERYRQLVQFAPTGIYEVDFRTGRFTSVNDAMCQILGYTRDELLALSAFDILDDEGKSSFAARIRRGQAGEQLNEAVEYRVRKKDGHIIWGLLNSTFHWEGGRIVGATVVANDITERKQMEQALRSSEEKFRGLVKYAPAAIYEMDLQGSKFLSVNDAMCSILQYSREELLSTRPADLLDKQSGGLFGERIRQKLAGEKVDETVEYRIRRKDGEWIYVAVNVGAFTSTGENSSSVVVIAYDITERKQAEQALRASKDNLERLVVERTGELQSANTRLRALTRDIVTTQEEERRRVSRELHDEAGQALTALKLGLQTMQADLPASSSTYRQQLGEAVTLTDTTLEQIRMLAQDLRPPSLEAAGLDATLEGLCREFARRTQIHVSYSGVPLSGLTGPASICLYRFLQEALTNAARHGHATRIQVCLEKDVEEATLAVADNGQGFDANRVLSSRDAPKSMGLIGMQERLMIVHGRLEIHSNPGQGARLIAHVSLEQP